MCCHARRMREAQKEPTHATARCFSLQLTACAAHCPHESNVALLLCGYASLLFAAHCTRSSPRGRDANHETLGNVEDSASRLLGLGVLHSPRTSSFSASFFGDCFGLPSNCFMGLSGAIQRSVRVLPLQEYPVAPLAFSSCD